MPRFSTCAVLVALIIAVSSGIAIGDGIAVPRRHDRPPNQPYSADEAAKRMTTPVGFSVEVVAAEPQIINPVAMFIDERGRFWVTESFEYPRREPGPGRDRIKVLEDTDGDGQVDKVTVFAEGLNIPSGIAVGYGGVWVFNAPDLLYLEDTDGDGKADRTKVLMTGFGRTDTHELPNSLTWGPDGWLYGLNGVFNYSRVTYGKDNPNFDPDQKLVDFTCALFRIHPRTLKFEIFAEGTSNPWGLAINDEGEFFISACVIDHLWHLVESGYYIRQGGPYPPHTWPIRSIVQHKHQKAAYCGLVWFDSGAYPPEYRGNLYMGNIHGGCLNADVVERSGATFQGRPHPGFPAKPGAWDKDEYGTIAKAGDPANPRLADLMTANDAWFMPVSQKVGPDGCLYVLDWYDRYHCYQDANADPAGIDRAKGRLYRLHYEGVPRAKPFDLNQKTDEELIELLGSPNIYYRETAQRLLGERDHAQSAVQLESLLFSDAPRTQRMHAMWARAGFSVHDNEWPQRLLASDDPVFRSWGIRYLREHQRQQSGSGAASHLPEFQLDQMSPPELLQLVVSARDGGTNSVPLLLRIAAITDDNLIDQVVWRALVPKFIERPNEFVDALLKEEKNLSGLTSLLPRSLAVICGKSGASDKSIGKLIGMVLRATSLSDQVKTDCLVEVRKSFLNANRSPQQLAEILDAAQPDRVGLAGKPAMLVKTLKAITGDMDALNSVREQLIQLESSEESRADAMTVLVALKDPALLPAVKASLARKDLQLSRDFRISLLEAVSKLNDPQVADVILVNFANLEQDIQPKAIEVLTQRPSWAVALLREIDGGQLDKSLLNLNQLIRLRTFNHDEVQSLVSKHYGTIRTERSNRQGVISQHRDFLFGTPGDPRAGVAVYNRVCAQCHKIYGHGADVGPDITRSGRNNWDQLLQNVFDPSAVIGPGYQARIIATEDGRVLTGIPVEDSSDRVVLKIQGGKLESIPRSQIEEDKLSELSLMPEDLEKLMSPQELADLFAFLALDKEPNDASAKVLPGAPPQRKRK